MEGTGLAEEPNGKEGGKHAGRGEEAASDECPPGW